MLVVWLSWSQCRCRIWSPPSPSPGQRRKTRVTEGASRSLPVLPAEQLDRHIYWTAVCQAFEILNVYFFILITRLLDHRSYQLDLLLWKAQQLLNVKKALTTIWFDWKCEWKPLTLSDLDAVMSTTLSSSYHANFVQLSISKSWNLPRQRVMLGTSCWRWSAQAEGGSTRFAAGV